MLNWLDGLRPQAVFASVPELPGAVSGGNYCHGVSFGPADSGRQRQSIGKVTFGLVAMRALDVEIVSCVTLVAGAIVGLQHYAMLGAVLLMLALQLVIGSRKWLTGWESAW